MKQGGRRWRFAVGRKITFGAHQWWEVWNRGDHGEEEVLYYQFQPGIVYWLSEQQFSGYQNYRNPPMAKQRGNWSTDREWLYISWLDEKGLPYASEQWDLPLFDEHQTGIALDPHLGEY